VNNGSMSSSVAGLITLTSGDGGSSSTGAFSSVSFTSGAYTLTTGAVLDGAVQLNGASVTIGGAVSAAPTSTLSLSTGTLTVPGTFTAAGSTTSSIPLTVTGGINVTGTLTWNSNSISGSGVVSIRPTGTLIIDTSNTHTLASGATLDVAGTATWPGTGAIGAWDGSLIRISGRFDVTGDRSISDFSGSGVDPQVTNTGVLVKSTGTGAFSCECVLDNTGTLELDSGTATVTHSIAQYNPTRRTLTRGHFILAGTLSAPNLDIATDASDVQFTTATGGLRDTSGNDALGSLTTITSQGRLSLSNGASVSTASSLSNAGAVEIGPNASLTTAGTYTQSAGSTALTSSTSTLATSTGTSFTGGAVTGAGTITGNTDNTGAVIDPGGASPATLSISGNYTAHPNATLHLDITPTGHDQLNVSGTASLDGTLGLSTSTGYTPASGTVVPLVTYATRSGHFNPVTGSTLTNGDVYWLTDTGSELDATVQSPTTIPAPTVQINRGATRTNTTTVSAAITPPAGFTPTGMRLANDADPTSAFTGYASPTSWTLPASDGSHDVHVQLQDSLGNTTSVAVASILLDTTAPTVTITPPTTTTGPVTMTASELVTGANSTNVVLRLSGSTTNLPSTLSCLDASNTQVGCNSGQYVTVDVQPTAPLLPAASYVVIVNPTGTATQLHDLAGNAAAQTARTFTL
jgi:hypothetical protein